MCPPPRGDPKAPFKALIFESQYDAYRGVVVYFRVMEGTIRTGMEAVCTLLNVDRGVPEVWGSVYDIRCLLDATVKLRDGRKITDMEMPLVGKLAMKEALKKIEGTEVEKLLKEYNVI